MTRPRRATADELLTALRILRDARPLLDLLHVIIRDDPIMRAEDERVVSLLARIRDLEPEQFLDDYVRHLQASVRDVDPDECLSRFIGRLRQEGT